MKKNLVSMIIVLAVAFSLFAGGCAKEDIVELNIAALKGPTAMGMIKMMDDASKSEKEGPWDFTLVASPDLMAPLVIQGEVDIAAVPANLAATLYNKTEGKIKVIGINTLGVIYIVEKGEEVNSISDLKGKTIYASGQGATPEFALNYILRENGIDPQVDVTIEWKSEHAECLSALNSEEGGIAMLPQPFVTVAMTQAEGLRVALDLTEEWDKLQEGKDDASMLITGVVVAGEKAISEKEKGIKEFLKTYEESVEFVNENPKEAGEMIGNFDIVPQPIAEKAIPNCNIVLIQGEEMKKALSGYLQVLYDADPKSVGGALPQDDFYYE